MELVEGAESLSGGSREREGVGVCSVLISGSATGGGTSSVRTSSDMGWEMLSVTSIFYSKPGKIQNA